MQSYILKESCKIIEKLGIEYWLCNGTLLGLIRDHKLIPWDVDLDIGILSINYSENIIEEFLRVGYQLVDNGKGSSYRTLQKNQIKVDINIFDFQNHELVSLWRVSKINGFFGVVCKFMEKFQIKIPNLKILWTLEGYSVVYKDIYPLKKLYFDGFYYSTPGCPEKVLEHIYGANWRIPIQNFNWRTHGASNRRGELA